VGLASGGECSWQSSDRKNLEVGVDEAGRGSIVGEMFVAAYAIPIGCEEVLTQLGVRDSKELTPRSRASLYKSLVRIGRVCVSTVSPREIDSDNLNKLTENSMLRSILCLARNVGGIDKIKVIIIDKFGVPKKLPRELKERGFRGLLVIEEKADARYPVVAAASIVAKHLRDTRMKVLRSIYGVPGSGYPSDARTMEWVRSQLKRGARPPIIRYSWSTLREFGYGMKRKGERLDRWLE
jgi:ribonuclease HII